MFKYLSKLNNSIYFKISLASPLNILKWCIRVIDSHVIIGQIKEPNTINYYTGIPELNGLFCEKIFGPIISWQCKCNFYNIKNPYKYATICSICGSENNSNLIRRYRMGYIYLNAPIIHYWYINTFLNKFLNIPDNILESLIYYKNFQNTKKYFSLIKILFSTNYIQELLNKLNILNEIFTLRSILNTTNSFIKRKTLTKLISIYNLFILNNINPSWIVLDILPVIPAGIRPFVKLSSKNYIISSINELYKQIILKNNKLKRWQILRKNTPLFFEILEKRHLQQSIDNLLKFNTNHSNKISLTSGFQGKKNYFRQYILGKRVDFSARSVIISGPDIPLGKIGISLNLSLELFKPIILNLLKSNNKINSLLKASFLVEKNSFLIKRILTFIFKKEIIMVNRAPTLHKMNIQAFKPYLIENEIIKLFPIACSGFNADFDGDQMGLFLIMSSSAKKEAKRLFSFDKNLFSPSLKKNMFKFSQNIILGINSLLNFKGDYINNLIFKNIFDALIAFNHNLIKINTPILIYYKFQYNNKIKNYYIISSIGRLILQKLS